VATKTSIPITKPLIGEEELRAVQLPLETGWVIQGPHVQAFEEKLSAYTGASHSIATSSCTTALQISVAALGLEPGDEVIVPAFTFVSTANVVEHTAASAVFCDVDLAMTDAEQATVVSELRSVFDAVMPPAPRPGAQPAPSP
jgi:dTDP-4-amino-4,6-dideoxygalactose transaminase